MLRALVLLLLAANAFWWAASHGWLPAAWLPLPNDEAQRDPKRLAQQVRPEAIIVLPPGQAQRAAAPARACLQSTPLTSEAAQAAAEAALRSAGVAEARWQRVDRADGNVLRIEGVDARTAAALAASAAADGPGFSPCP